MDFIRDQNTRYFYWDFDFGPVKLPGLSRNGPPAPGFSGKSFSICWCFLWHFPVHERNWLELPQISSDEWYSIFRNFRNSRQSLIVGGAVASWLVPSTPERAGGLSSTPGQGHCVVFFGKTLYSHGAFLHPGVLMGAGESNAGGNPAMD